MLHEHGTTLCRLKASNIVQAAERDLRLRERKREEKAEPEEQYAFARRQVQRAQSAAHLIALAYYEPGPGIASTKDSTRIIYQDAELLRVTLVGLLMEAEP